MEKGAFSACWSLESITIAEGLENLGDYVFSGCSNLTIVSIPFSMKSIGTGAFDQCNKLGDVYYNGTEAQWKSIRRGSGSFTSEFTVHYKYIAEGVCGAQGDNLTWILYNDGTLVISGTGDMASFENGKPWDSYIGKVRNITIEPGVTSIGACMYSFSRITSFVVPEGIETIGSSAFSNCSELATIYLPSSLTNISGNAFVECRALRDIYFNGTKAQWNAISKPDYLLKNAELHLAVLTVSYNANGGFGMMNRQTVDRGMPFSLNLNTFYRDKYIFLTWNTKPDGSGIAYFDMETIDNISEDLMLYAQWGKPDCILPSELTEIGEDAFANSAFTFVKLSEKTEKIGPNAFAGCQKLAYIYIPSVSIDIDPTSFGNRTNLTIYGKSGSPTEDFANNKGITFVAIS